MTYLEQFKISPGTAVRLDQIDPAFTAGYAGRNDAAAELEHYLERLRDLQELLYAGGRHSLLLCLQAMDTGGKDGTIKRVLGAMNPQGCRVVAFRQPSAEELTHDFLWRVHRAVPARGEVVVFNRSHYEDVLIVRVQQLVAADVWSRRYDRINAFEQGLADHDTHVLKFYLHISKDEQLRRLEDRLDDPTKQWKVAEGDYQARKQWDDYMAAYQDAVSRCATAAAPWFVIPADHKWFRDLAVARIVVEYLERLRLVYPEPKADIGRLRRRYHTARRASRRPR